MKLKLLIFVSLLLLVGLVSANSNEFFPQFDTLTSGDVVHYNVSYAQGSTTTMPVSIVILFFVIGLIIFFASIPPLWANREILYPILAIPFFIISGYGFMVSDWVFTSGVTSQLENLTNSAIGGPFGQEWISMEAHTIIPLWYGTLMCVMFTVFCIINIFRILTLSKTIGRTNVDVESDDE